MNAGSSFYLLSGLWAGVTIAIFISAIRLCYEVEERSDDLRNRSGLPRWAAVPQVAANAGVARDAETQALRRRMNLRLLLVLVLMALFAIATGFITE